MMIFFDSVYILTIYPSSMLIQWQLNNSSLPENYFFDVYLAETEEGDWTKVNDTPIANHYCYELPAMLLSKQEYLWVKISFKR